VQDAPAESATSSAEPQADFVDAPSEEENTPEPATIDDSQGEHVHTADEVDIDRSADAMAHGEVYDDDAVIVPAPSADAFVHHPPKPRPKKVHVAVYKTLKFKRTIIPILLTSGLLLIIFGVSRFIAGPDSPLSVLPMWLIATVFVMALLLLVFGAMTMLQVKDELMRSQAEESV
jgi:hypothetical protein